MILAQPNKTTVRLCVASHHSSLDALISDAALEALWAAEPSALVELRLDGYADVTCARLEQALVQLGPQRCVLTCRVPEQGGLGRTNTADSVRAAYVRLGQRLGVHAIDLETTSLQRHAELRALWQQGPAMRVASAHTLDKVPSLAQLHAQRAEAEGLGADVVKIVVGPSHMLDTEPLLSLLETPSPQGTALIGLATGPAGVWSRLLCGRWANPAPWTYVSLPSAVPVASGQPSWIEAQSVYRIQHVHAATPVLGVVGAPVAHSQSPALHNSWLAQAQMPGIYLPLHLADRLDAFVRSMAARMGIAGLSVTHPLKGAAFLLAAHRTAMAQATGAVNTLWRANTQDDSGWHGDNTDVDAAVDSLVRLAGGPLCGRSVAILGAGGAAHAVAWGAQRAGARVRVWARRPSQADALAKAISCGVLAEGPIGPQLGEHALVVNCTPVGMPPHIDEMVVPIEGFAPSTCFFDTIYAPAQTAWLRAAQAKKHKVCNGMAMLEHQARAQFQRFTRSTGALTPYV